MKPRPVDLIALAAERLGPLADDMVFVGGAVVALLMSAPASRPPRETDDVDAITVVGTRLEYAALEDELRRRGFANDLRGPICRFLAPALVLDVVPVDPDILGFSNRWYPEAIRSAEPATLPTGRVVRRISAPTFLATKFEAFRSESRENAGDLYASHDFEDIVVVIDGRPNLREDLQAADAAVRDYVATELRVILQERYLEEAIEGHLGPDEPTRSAVILRRIQAIAGMA